MQRTINWDRDTEPVGLIEQLKLIHEHFSRPVIGHRWTEEWVLVTPDGNHLLDYSPPHMIYIREGDEILPGDVIYDTRQHAQKESEE